MIVCSMGFRENVRDEISYQGLQIKEVAAVVGISYGSFLSYVDARAVLPNVEVAVKIARALGVSVEYLVTGKDSPYQANTDSIKPYKNLIKELSQLSQEGWEKLEPLFMAMIQQEKKTQLKKNEGQVSSS